MSEHCIAVFRNVQGLIAPRHKNVDGICTMPHCGVMDEIQRIVARIQAWLRAKEMPHRELVARGVASRTMYDAQKPGWNPGARIMSQFLRIIPDDWEPEEPEQDKDQAA
jgi:hypothetical protein